MTKLAAHSVTYHRGTNCLGDRETDARAFRAEAFRVEAVGESLLTDREMDDETAAPSTASAANCRSELRTPPQPRFCRQHGRSGVGDVRPTGPDGPSGDGRRGWHGRRECA